MKPTLLLLIISTLFLMGQAGCEEDTDADADGWTTMDGDCDDSDANVHPGADETCDGVDEDCDAMVDEVDEDGDGVSDCGDDICLEGDDFVDLDGDGLPDACDDDVDGDGWSTDDGDCDDSDADVNPSATETCNGIDDDCNDLFDDIDDDSDGVNDCEDDVCLGGDDSVDFDGDGVPDDCDEDADGDDWSVSDGDCDDWNAEVNPSAEESCNGLDDDCDGVADILDEDGDGYNDCDEDVCPGGDDSVDFDGDGIPDDCDDDKDGDGWSAGDGDCDDQNEGINPGAQEDCNNIDDDCNGEVDDIDEDWDGFNDCYEDVCLDGDDAEDMDGDGIPDACDDPFYFSVDEETGGPVRVASADMSYTSDPHGYRIYTSAYNSGSTDMHDVAFVVPYFYFGTSSGSGYYVGSWNDSSQRFEYGSQWAEVYSMGNDWDYFSMSRGNTDIPLEWTMDGYSATVSEDSWVPAIWIGDIAAGETVSWEFFVEYDSVTSYWNLVGFFVSTTEP